MHVSEIEEIYDFNPRSPHGERRESVPASAQPRHFNPRSPHGERRLFGQRGDADSLFQPTLPARGATRRATSKSNKQISTHAPRTGSDLEPISKHKKHLKFQPTLPARGATSTRYWRMSSRTISTHAPRTGSDPVSPAERRNDYISTHAPRTGSDDNGRLLYAAEHLHFNPRSPHGERRGSRGTQRPRVSISTHAPRTGSDPQGSACRR